MFRKVVQIQGKTPHQSPFRNTSYRNNVHIRLDLHSKRFVSWCTSHSPTGFMYGSIDGNSVKSVYEHSSFGSLTFLKDPGLVVGSGGQLLTSAGKKKADLTKRNGMLFAVEGANMVIKVIGTKATLVDALNQTELQSFDLPFSIKRPNWTKTGFTGDRRAYASAHLNRAAFIDVPGQQVVVFKIAEGNNAAVMAEQLTGVKAGTVWKRKLKYPANTRVTLEDAPDGVRLDTKTLTLHWSIPRGEPAGSKLILISVRQPGKDETYERVSVTIK